MKICHFCNKNLYKISHHNLDLFDLFLCSNCLFPDYHNQYRELYFFAQEELLAASFKLDEFYVVLNYSFNFTNKRANYTTIYKNSIENINVSDDLEPIVWEHSYPLVCDIDHIVEFPFHDPARLKNKLRICALFS